MLNILVRQNFVYKNITLFIGKYLFTKYKLWIKPLHWVCFKIVISKFSSPNNINVSYLLLNDENT